MKKRLSFLVLSFLVLLSSASLYAQKQVRVVNGEKVIKGEIIVKVKDAFLHHFKNNDFSNPNFIFVANQIKITETQKKFPKIYKPRIKYNDQGQELVDLSSIYTINYSANIEEPRAAQLLYMTGMFEYATYQVVPDLMYTPDDPKVGSQYHLDVIKAFEAWDIQKGDSSVVIGITDTGIDTDHPEVVGRVKRNYQDPIDGVDNDYDGYVDNYFGWDTGSEDNDPEVWGHHGNQVTGCASINTDNGAHVAAVGFNTMILPVKICNDAGYLVGAYEGIIYAADHGADIINCSWGGAGSFNQYHQDVINYATFNKGALVVAAAGNSNATTYFYPASYQNVISVAGTNAADEKWTQSSNEGSQYNDKVDVCAPSHNIIGIWRGGGSGLIGRGTSFGCPIASGVAALIKAEYPNASPQKIGAILKTTADDIYSIPGNEVYEGMLGTGRVNAYRALQPVSTPYITFHSYDADDGLEQNFAAGDTVLMTVKLTNHLASTSNISVILKSANGFTTVLDSISYINSLNTDETKEVAVPFKFIVNNSVSPNSNAQFTLYISNGVEEWEDGFGLPVNRDYVDITTNNLDVSFNNYGRIGYTFSGDGVGVNYKESGSLVKDMGVLLAVNETNVLSYEDYELLSFDPAVVNSSSTLSSSEATFTASGTLADDWSMNPVGVKVHQTAYAWTSENNKDYVIYEYIIENPGSASLDSIYLGLFSDWNIGNGNQNEARYESSRDIGYAYEVGGYYAGVKALRSNRVNYYSFDMTGNSGGIDVSDNFNDSEEYESMTSGIANPSSSGDVANIISQGPYSVDAGDSVVVAFAIVAGESLDDLKTNAQYAELMYEKMRGIKIGVEDFQNVTCAGMDNGVIDLDIELGFPPYDVKWYHDSAETSEDLNSVPAGDYNVEVTDKYGIAKKMNFKILEPSPLEAELISIDDISCYGDDDGEIDLVVNGGTGSYFYKWNDSKIPNISNPQLSEGNYVLEVSDVNGCKDSLTFSINAPDPIDIFQGFKLDDTLSTCDGEIALIASGGVAPYQYIWNNGAAQTDNSFYGLCGGEYEATVIDANGCEQSATFEILSPNSTEEVNSYGDLVSSFVLYPNPADEYLIVEFTTDNAEDFDISVLDIEGKLIQKVYADRVNDNSYKVFLNAGLYNAGSYLIALTSPKGKSVFKFEVYH